MAAPRKAAVAEEGRPAPFLDLNSRDTHIDFVYGDKAYYVVGANELSITAQETLSRFYLKIREVSAWEGDDDGVLSESQETAIQEIEFRFFRAIVPEATEAELRAIPPHQRQRVVNAFTQEVDQRPFLAKVIQKATQDNLSERVANVTRMRQQTAPGSDTGTTSTNADDTPQDSPHAVTAP